MKSPILLLHGAIGSQDQLSALAAALAERFTVHALNFPGHGKEAMSGAFSIAGFAAVVKDYMDAHSLQRPLVFGYSMGGYVALYLEKTNPGSFAGIVTLATKFAWDADAAERECKMLQPDVLEQKVPSFAATLAQRHGDNWKDLLYQTQTLLRNIGANPPLTHADISDIKTPVLLLIDDRDKMVSIEETLNVYRQLPNSQFAVLPGTPHPIEQVRFNWVVEGCRLVEGM